MMQLHGEYVRPRQNAVSLYNIMQGDKKNTCKLHGLHVGAHDAQEGIVYRVGREGSQGANKAAVKHCIQEIEVKVKIFKMIFNAWMP